MSERIRGSYDDALYKLTYTLLYFTYTGQDATIVFVKQQKRLNLITGNKYVSITRETISLE